MRVATPLTVAVALFASTVALLGCGSPAEPDQDTRMVMVAFGPPSDTGGILLSRLPDSADVRALRAVGATYQATIRFTRTAIVRVPQSLIPALAEVPDAWIVRNLGWETDPEVVVGIARPDSLPNPADSVWIMQHGATGLYFARNYSSSSWPMVIYLGIPLSRVEELAANPHFTYAFLDTGLLYRM